MDESNFIDAKDRESVFRAMLNGLLKSSGAEIRPVVTWSEATKRHAVNVVTLPAVYSDEGSLKKEYAQFVL